MPVEATCTNEEKVNFHLNPTTSTGQPAQLEDGSEQWVVQSGDGTVEPAGDGLSCFVVSGANPGDTVVLVSGDADLGQGVQTISDLITLHVTGAMAQNLGVTSDPAVPK